MQEKEINKYWKRIVNTMNDGLMLIGPDGTILMVNNAFEHLTGYTSGEVIGMSCSLLQCSACEKTLITRDENVYCTLFEEGHGDIKQCRCFVQCRNGTVLPMLKNASVLRDDQGAILGAVETLTDISELTRLDQQVHQLVRQFDREEGFWGLIGKTQAMRTVFDMVQKAADSNAPVMILGESGTGKELVANAIHMCGCRKSGPFIQLNCAALNPSLLESELFGHAKGAFTGAHRHRTGRFEAASGGDFFLDEIGDVPLPIQTKLLRVLESGRFERVGELTSVRADVRIITATNKNLRAMMAAGDFREDLFFRISVIPIHLPPLRTRKEDIPLLVNTFMHRLNTSTGKSIRALSPGAMARFMDYDWPGNVREMKNALEYAYVVAEGDVIRFDELPQQLREPVGNALLDSAPVSVPGPLSSEKENLIAALKAAGGNQSQAARLLKINRVTVWNRMKKHGIDLKKVLTS